MRPRAIKALLRRAVCFFRGGLSGESCLDARVGPWEMPPRRAVCFFAGVAEGALAADALEVEALEADALEAEALVVVALVVVVTLVVVVFAFFEGPASSSAFLLAPATFAGVEVEALETFLASRSFFVHSFFSLPSIFITSAGTLRLPAFTASNNRMRATDFVFDG